MSDVNGCVREDGPSPADLDDVLAELMRRVAEGGHATGAGDRLEVRFIAKDKAMGWKATYVVCTPFDPATCIAQPPAYVAKRTPSVGWP